MSLTRLAIQRPLTVLMVILGIVLMGGVSYTHLRIDRLPPITIPFLGVNVTYPQASAQDVEQLVTQPIENAVSGMAGVDSISSTSSEGRASVTIQFSNGTNIDAAALDVGRRVAAIRRVLPADASDPTIFKADPNSTPIMNVALSGAPLDQLYDLANTQLQPQLQSISGVASVTIQGGLQREIQVTLDYAKLAAFNITVAQLNNALTAANVTAPVGALDLGTRSVNLRSVGAFEQVDSLKRLVITQTTTGGPVMLQDVATISDGYKQVTQYQRMNGKEAVGLTIVKQSDANELKVANDVRAALDRLKGILPDGTQLQITNDNSVFTRASLEAIQHDLIIAVILVGAVMLLFLHQWKNTAIVLFAIPTVLISTFLFMYMLGFTLNIMTLMALALMIGILVDDSIVVLENIHRHLEMGESPRDAALNGRNEIGMAAVAITLADVIVYAPIAFVSGTVGQLFQQYGLTVVIATLLSLIVSFTLTPMVSSRWLRHTSPEAGRGPMARFGRWWDGWFARLGALVGWLIPVTVRLRWPIAIASIAVFLACGALIRFGFIGTEYAPTEDDGNIRVNMNMPSGTSLATRDDGARQLEAALGTVPEIRNVFTNVGGGGANISVELVPKNERERSAQDVAQSIRDLGRNIPGATVSANIASPLGGGGGGVGGLEVQVQGSDLDTLTQLANEVTAVAATVPGLTPLTSNGLAATPEFHIKLDPARMAQLGVTSQTVATALRTTLAGSTVTQLRRPGQPQVDITVIGNPVSRANLTDLMSLPVASSAGAGVGAAAAAGATPVLLGQIATVVPGTGPVQITRVNRNRSLSLRGSATAGRPLGAVASDLRAALANVDAPPGYSVVIGGQAQQLNTALASLGQALVMAVVLEYMLLVALYQSWFYPLVRMMAVPLGLIGSLLGLMLTHNTLNIFSIIGLVMAEGLVAKSSILLIDYTNTLREQGMGRVEALAEAARTRLRPILMTSATMVFGMFPLALKLEAGAESRAPIAIVVIGALISSTILTVLVVPALYTLFDDLSVWCNGLFSRDGHVSTGADGGQAIEAAAEPAPLVGVFGDGDTPGVAPRPTAPEGAVGS
ncbi:MAG: efflux RND transporter permease subunit [Chloroflexota bacterium]